MARQRWWRSTLGLVALVSLFPGCASKSENSDDDVQPSLSNAEIALEVENHSWSDIVIYLVRGTAAERIGMVGSLNTKTIVLSLPPDRRERHPAPRRSHRQPDDLHQ